MTGNPTEWVPRKLERVIPYACWHTTLRCNMRPRCRWCYAPKSGPEVRGREMVAVGGRLARCCERVSLMGGEPLLNPDTLPVARMMRSAGCGLSLVTNGTLLTPDIVAELARVLDRMSVSVDAVDQAVATACRGSAYDIARVICGVGLVAQAGIPLKINTLASSLNADHLPEIGRLLESLRRPVDWKLAEPAETAFTERGDIVPIRLERTDFLEIAADLASRFPSLSVRTVLHDGIGDYVLVMPDGDLFIPSVNGSRPIGNVAHENPQDFLARWGWDPSGNAELFKGRAARRAAPETGCGE